MSCKIKPFTTIVWLVINDKKQAAKHFTRQEDWMERQYTDFLSGALGAVWGKKIVLEFVVGKKGQEG